jgi:VCBS repeat-containing protein
VQEAIPHVVNVGYGDHVKAIDFGNMTNGDNRRPTAIDDQYEVDEDDELTVAAKGVLTNDDDPDGDTLSAVLIDEPQHGEVSLDANGSFTYTPDPGYFGDDQFEYAASDGQLQSNTATVDITIQSLNDAPLLTARGPSAVTNEELARTLAVADFVNNGGGTTLIQDDVRLNSRSWIRRLPMKTPVTNCRIPPQWSMAVPYQLGWISIRLIARSVGLRRYRMPVPWKSVSRPPIPARRP